MELFDYDAGEGGGTYTDYNDGSGEGDPFGDSESWWSDDDGGDDWADSALDMASNVWDWANTSAGVSTIGGALAGGLSIWGEQRAQDDRMEYADQMTEFSRAKTERINKHNESINAPTELNMRKWTGKK